MSIIDTIRNRQANKRREQELDTYKEKGFPTKDAYRQFLDWRDKTSAVLSSMEKKLANLETRYGKDSREYLQYRKEYLSYRQDAAKTYSSLAEVGAAKKGGKGKIVAGVAVAGAAAGGVGYMVMNNNGGNTTTPPTPTPDPVVYPDEIYKVLADSQGMSDAKVVELLKADPNYSENALKLFNKFTQESNALNGVIDTNYAALGVIEEATGRSAPMATGLNFGEYAVYTRGEGESFIHFMNETQYTAQDLVNTNEQIVIDTFKENFPATAQNMQNNGYEITFENIQNWNNCIGTYDEMVAYNSDCVNSGMQISDIINSQAGQTVTQNQDVLTWYQNTQSGYLRGLDDAQTVLDNLSTINTAKADLVTAQTDYTNSIIDMQSNIISNGLDAGSLASNAGDAVMQSAMSTDHTEGANQTLGAAQEYVPQDDGGLLHNLAQSATDVIASAKMSVVDFANANPELTVAAVTAVAVAGASIVAVYKRKNKQNIEKAKEAEVEEAKAL